MLIIRGFDDAEQTVAIHNPARPTTTRLYNELKWPFEEGNVDPSSWEIFNWAIDLTPTGNLPDVDLDTLQPLALGDQFAEGMPEVGAVF